MGVGMGVRVGGGIGVGVGAGTGELVGTGVGEIDGWSFFAWAAASSAADFFVIVAVKVSVQALVNSFFLKLIR